MNSDPSVLEEFSEPFPLAFEALEVVGPADGATADDDVGERSVGRLACEEGFESFPISWSRKGSQYENGKTEDK